MKKGAGAPRENENGEGKLAEEVLSSSSFGVYEEEKRGRLVVSRWLAGAMGVEDLLEPVLRCTVRGVQWCLWLRASLRGWVMIHESVIARPHIPSQPRPQARVTITAL